MALSWGHVGDLVRIYWRFLKQSLRDFHETRERQRPRIPVWVINLPHRFDRKSSALDQLATIARSDVSVFAGIHRKNGALGCSLSHRDLLQFHAQNSEGPVWVNEDDISFIADGDTIDSHLKEFIDSPGIDVLCLAHVTKRASLPISKQLALTACSFTTASYVVKPSAIPTLLKYIHDSVALLSFGSPARIGAIDVQWQRAQRESLVFAIPRSPLAYQAASFSDVEDRHVDYYLAPKMDKKKNRTKSRVSRKHNSLPFGG